MYKWPQEGASATGEHCSGSPHCPRLSDCSGNTAELNIVFPNPQSKIIAKCQKSLSWGNAGEQRKQFETFAVDHWHQCGKNALGIICIVFLLNKQTKKKTC